jgi:two-component system NtrC family response regulator
MPLPMQAKLLRVLQDHEVTPVGSQRTRRIDVRVIAATHRDLAQAVVEGRFRPDLRFRLDVLRIHLPPLRERLADIVPLAEHFLRLSASGKGLSREAGQCLMGHSWPGNVRELRNVIERAAAVARGGTLTAGDIEIDAGPSGSTSWRTTLALEADSDLTLPEAVERLERHWIESALQRARGNRAEAARLLGIRRQLLYAKLAALGLDSTSK